jgi:hypothetical protein
VIGEILAERQVVEVYVVQFAPLCLCNRDIQSRQHKSFVLHCKETKKGPWGFGKMGI